MDRRPAAELHARPPFLARFRGRPAELDGEPSSGGAGLGSSIPSCGGSSILPKRPRGPRRDRAVARTGDDARRGRRLSSAAHLSHRGGTDIPRRWTRPEAASRGPGWISAGSKWPKRLHKTSHWVRSTARMGSICTQPRSWKISIMPWASGAGRGPAKRWRVMAKRRAVVGFIALTY